MLLRLHNDDESPAVPCDVRVRRTNTDLRRITEHVRVVPGRVPPLRKRPVRVGGAKRDVFVHVRIRVAKAVRPAEMFSPRLRRRVQLPGPQPRQPPVLHAVEVDRPVCLRPRRLSDIPRQPRIVLAGRDAAHRRRARRQILRVGYRWSPRTRRGHHRCYDLFSQRSSNPSAPFGSP